MPRHAFARGKLESMHAAMSLASSHAGLPSHSLRAYFIRKKSDKKYDAEACSGGALLDSVLRQQCFVLGSKRFVRLYSAWQLGLHIY